MQTVLWVLLIAVLPGAILLLALTTTSLHAKFLGQLRLKYAATWNDLRRPRLFWSWLPYKLWLLRGGYDALGDPELSALGSRVSGASILAAVLLAVWFGCAVLGGYVQWR
jgi:hypothetical protein